MTQMKPIAPVPQEDLQTVVQGRTREWHFHIYFLLQSPTEKAAALALRDAVLKLRRDGKSISGLVQTSAFVAVPLHRVNEYPIGPHPAGSYESERTAIKAVLIHPLTEQQRRDHESRNGWLGKPWPIYLDGLPRDSDQVPLQYPELRLGWSSAPENEVSLDERRKRGAEIEALLAKDPEAAPAPAHN
ncbi:hypothetical protein G3M48_010282 [Beauveria asiatica]|uniref:DOPA 4,5-dioxygenase n=1 Tax=Beauveria asiatica TaxID=1069075 RepID=A0AAW0S1S2_9HYPO